MYKAFLFFTLGIIFANVSVLLFAPETFSKNCQNYKLFSEMNELPTFLDFFCFRLATAENESNNVHSEEDEEDSDDDDDVQIKFDKVVNTNTTNAKLLFVYQSPNMQRLYQRYASSLIMLDATYRTTKYALPLFFMVVKTNVNYQVRHRLFYHGTHIIQVHFPCSIYQCF